jgi:hypothetical protein
MRMVSLAPPVSAIDAGLSLFATFFVPASNAVPVAKPAAAPPARLKNVRRESLWDCGLFDMIRFSYLYT